MRTQADHRGRLSAASGRAPGRVRLAGLALAALGAWVARPGDTAAQAPAAVPATQPTAPTTQSAELARQIAAAIKDLGSSDWQTRERASGLLWKLGRPAEPALREAAKSPDAEVALRANTILDKFRYGLYPDTPKQIADLVEQYRSGSLEVKLQTVTRLIQLGHPAVQTVSAIASAEDNAEIKRQIIRSMGEQAPLFLAVILSEGRLDEADRWLAGILAKDSDSASRNYAAFLLLTGRIDRKIRQCQDAPDPVNQDLLVYLWRAKGDLDKARQVAVKANLSQLEREIALEQGDWKWLAEDLEEGNPPAHEHIEALGLAAAYHRLAGNRRQADKAIAEIVKIEVKGSEFAAFQAPKTLLVNDRPREAIDFSIRQEDSRRAFDLLLAQERYAEAFKVAEKAAAQENPNEPAAGFRVRQAMAVALHHLGEKEKARAILDDLFKQGKDQQNTPALSHAAEGFRRIGLKEQADLCVEALIDNPALKEDYRAVLDHRLPRRSGEADMLWRVLAKALPDDDFRARLRRVEAVLGDKPARPELEALLAKLTPKDLAFPQVDEFADWYATLARACWRAGLKDEALAWLESWEPHSHGHSTAGAAGDLLAEDKQWAEAVECYARARQRFPAKPVLTFRHGYALTQAGRRDEGGKLIELAELMPLADESARGILADELDERGMGDPARRQRNLILLTGAFRSYEVDDCLRHHASWEMSSKKDYKRAALYQERSRLILMRANISLGEFAGYLRLMMWCHYPMLTAHLEAGQADEALAEASVCLEAYPANVEVVIKAMPVLVKLGRKDQAEKLFAGVWDFHEAILKQYPKAASTMNSLAWLGARCRCRLDDARRLAEKAVELDPKSAGYLDTLAEVRFQQGDRRGAIELAGKCIELDTSGDKRLGKYLQGQLQRFTSGEPSSDPPPETGADGE